MLGISTAIILMASTFAVSQTQAEIIRPVTNMVKQNASGFVVDKQVDWQCHDHLPKEWREAIANISLKVSSMQVYELYRSGWTLKEFLRVIEQAGHEEHRKDHSKK
jgi:hypothetical protein